MSITQKINVRFLVLLAFIMLAGLIRLITSFSASPIMNFTPIGAMALFGGAYFNSRWKAYLLPLVTLWLSDIILNRFLFFGEWRFFYEGFFWVYGTFALIVPFTGLPYPKTLEGYWTCLVAALPFLKNFFFGTVFYSALLFGSYESAQRRFPVLSVSKQLAEIPLQ